MGIWEDFEKLLQFPEVVRWSKHGNLPTEFEIGYIFTHGCFCTWSHEFSTYERSVANNLWEKFKMPSTYYQFNWYAGVYLNEHMPTWEATLRSKLQEKGYTHSTGAFDHAQFKSRLALSIVWSKVKEKYPTWNFYSKFEEGNGGNYKKLAIGKVKQLVQIQGGQEIVDENNAQNILGEFVSVENQSNDWAYINSKADEALFKKLFRQTEPSVEQVLLRLQNLYARLIKINSSVECNLEVVRNWSLPSGVNWKVTGVVFVLNIYKKIKNFINQVVDFLDDKLHPDIKGTVKPVKGANVEDDLVTERNWHIILRAIDLQIGLMDGTVSAIAGAMVFQKRNVLSEELSFEQTCHKFREIQARLETVRQILISKGKNVPAIRRLGDMPKYRMFGWVPSAITFLASHWGAISSTISLVVNLVERLTNKQVEIPDIQDEDFEEEDKRRGLGTKLNGVLSALELVISLLAGTRSREVDPEPVSNDIIQRLDALDKPKRMREGRNGERPPLYGFWDSINPFVESGTSDKINKIAMWVKETSFETGIELRDKILNLEARCRMAPPTFRPGLHLVVPSLHVPPEREDELLESRTFEHVSSLFGWRSSIDRFVTNSQAHFKDERERNNTLVSTIEDVKNDIAHLRSQFPNTPNFSVNTLVTRMTNCETQVSTLALRPDYGPRVISLETKNTSQDQRIQALELRGTGAVDTTLVTRIVSLEMKALTCDVVKSSVESLPRTYAKQADITNLQQSLDLLRTTVNGLSSQPVPHNQNTCQTAINGLATRITSLETAGGGGLTQRVVNLESRLEFKREHETTLNNLATAVGKLKETQTKVVEFLNGKFSTDPDFRPFTVAQADCPWEFAPGSPSSVSSLESCMEPDISCDEMARLFPLDDIEVIVLKKIRKQERQGIFSDFGEQWKKDVYLKYGCEADDEADESDQIFQQRESDIPVDKQEDMKEDEKCEARNFFSLEGVSMLKLYFLRMWASLAYFFLSMILGDEILQQAWEHFQYDMAEEFAQGFATFSQEREESFSELDNGENYSHGQSESLSGVGQSQGWVDSERKDDERRITLSHNVCVENKKELSHLLGYTVGKKRIWLTHAEIYFLNIQGITAWNRNVHPRSEYTFQGDRHRTLYERAGCPNMYSWGQTDDKIDEEPLVRKEIVMEVDKQLSFVEQVEVPGNLHPNQCVIATGKNIISLTQNPGSVLFYREMKELFSANGPFVGMFAPTGRLRGTLCLHVKMNLTPLAGIGLIVAYAEHGCPNQMDQSSLVAFPHKIWNPACEDSIFFKFHPISCADSWHPSFMRHHWGKILIAVMSSWMPAPVHQMTFSWRLAYDFDVDIPREIFGLKDFGRFYRTLVLIPVFDTNMLLPAVGIDFNAGSPCLGTYSSQMQYTLWDSMLSMYQYWKADMIVEVVKASSPMIAGTFGLALIPAAKVEKMKPDYVQSLPHVEFTLGMTECRKKVVFPSHLLDFMAPTERLDLSRSIADSAYVFLVWMLDCVTGNNVGNQYCMILSIVGLENFQVVGHNGGYPTIPHRFMKLNIAKPSNAPLVVPITNHNMLKYQTDGLSTYPNPSGPLIGRKSEAQNCENFFHCMTWLSPTRNPQNELGVGKSSQMVIDPFRFCFVNTNPAPHALIVHSPFVRACQMVSWIKGTMTFEIVWSVKAGVKFSDFDSLLRISVFNDDVKSLRIHHHVTNTRCGSHRFDLMAVGFCNGFYPQLYHSEIKKYAPQIVIQVIGDQFDYVEMYVKPSEDFKFAGVGNVLNIAPVPSIPMSYHMPIPV